MSFDLSLLPTVLTTGATGASTGGETTASAMGTGTSDFASLLSGSLADLNATPDTAVQASKTPVNIGPQITTPQGVLPQVIVASADAAQTVATPQVMPVSAALLQAQLPTVPSEMTAVPTNAALETATTPKALPMPTAPLQTAASGVVAQAIPALPEIAPEVVSVMKPQAAPTETPAAPVVVRKMIPTEAVLPAMVSAEIESPTAVPAPVTAQSVAVPVASVAAPILPDATIEEAPVIAAPAVKTADAKAVKSKPADSEAGKAAVKADETADEPVPVTPDPVVSLAVIAPPVTPVIAPVSQPVAAAIDENRAPIPAGKPAPAAPQAPASQAQAADAIEKNDANPVAATEGQAPSTPKFASLLDAASTPVSNPSAPAVKSQASIAAIPSASVAANVQADVQPAKITTPAPQTMPPVETAPVQKQAIHSWQNQVAPVQAVQVQTAQVQTVQAQTVQTAARKTTTISAENSAEIASTPVAAAPSGFSLVSAPVTNDATYTPAATPQTSAASLMSQTAVDNISALSVQINRRNAEGATKFTMELHPADLGKVDVALSIGRDGKMTAHMTFDSDMTAATFSAHESDLRQQLRDTGLQLSDDALSFSTRQKTDAVAQAQGHAVNANARGADDDSSGNSSQPQQQNTFTQPDSQQGQQRSHSQHLAQLAIRQAAADQAAADADLEALNSAIDASAARLNYRQSSSRLALDLSV